jgi:sRNA-binding regulator protein Hfq
MAERLERGPNARRMKKPRPDLMVKSRADELVAAGMPYQMALAVAHGRIDLNAALERMALRDRVNTLMDRHALTRALATQIALGHADLDQVLSRRRLEQHRTENRERTALVAGTQLCLVLSDGSMAKGSVDAVEPYQIRLGVDGEEARELHKLQLLYCYAPDDWKAVKKGVRVDKKRGAEPASPAVRPQDRYSCSDRRLFGYLDRSVDVNVSLVSGEHLRGQVTWFGRYEFGLKLRTDAEVTVFRHALREMAPAT